MLVKNWIDKNYEDIRKTIINITKGNHKHVHDDLIHEVIIMFMMDEKAEQLVIDNKAKFYIIRIALNQFRSTTSVFYREHLRTFDTLEVYQEKDEEEEYDMETEYIIQGILDELDNMLKSKNNKIRYRAMIMMLYFSNGFNFNQVSRILNITAQAVKRNYRKGVELLVENMKINKNISETLSYKILQSNILKYGRGQRNL